MAAVAVRAGALRASSARQDDGMTQDWRISSSLPGRRSAALAGIGLASALAVSACGGSMGAAAVPVPPSSPPSSLPATPPAQDPAGSVHPVTTVVVTDDPAVVAAGTGVEGTWVGGLADRLEAAGSPLALTIAAVDPSGFAADGASFTDLVVEQVVHETQLVVFFEAELGSVDATAVADGALEAFNAVEEAAPDAYVVVVGSHRYLPGAAGPSEEVRQAVQDAARRAEVVVDYIDPVVEGWPAGASATGFAELVLPHVEQLVAALSQSGAFD
jgi:hypothetical protein